MTRSTWKMTLMSEGIKTYVLEWQRRVKIRFFPQTKRTCKWMSSCFSFLSFNSFASKCGDKEIKNQGKKKNQRLKMRLANRRTFPFSPTFALFPFHIQSFVCTQRTTTDRNKVKAERKTLFLFCFVLSLLLWFPINFVHFCVSFHRIDTLFGSDNALSYVLLDRVRLFPTFSSFFFARKSLILLRRRRHHLYELLPWLVRLMCSF